MFRDEIKVNIGVVGVGEAVHDAVRFMKVTNLYEVDYYLMPPVSHMMSDLVFIKKWCDDTIVNLDLLLILSDLESEDVLSGVSVIADLGVQKGVLTLLVHAEDDAHGGKPKLVKDRLDAVSKLVASTVLIKAEQLHQFPNVEGYDLSVGCKSLAYYHALFALISPLVGQGYILVDLYWYYNLFVQKELDGGSTCLFGMGEASGNKRAKCAAGAAIEMIPLKQGSEDSVSSFLIVVAATEETLLMTEYEEVTNVIHTQAKDNEDVVTSMIFAEELGSKLQCFVFVVKK